MAAPDKSIIPRIDVHHHFFPNAEEKAKLNLSFGHRTPAENLPWTPEKSLAFMDSLQVNVAILSHPPMHMGAIGDSDRKRTRELNDDLRAICDKYPDRFGLFITLPFLHDVQGALDELAYGLDVLKADGVTLTSSYGLGENSKYLGDDTYDPIWAELDRRKAIVFVHGAMVPSASTHPHACLGLPVVEVPNETFKSAASLVVTGRKRKYPNVKIILSHMGGSSIILASRVAALSNFMGCQLSPEEIIEDFKTFYSDTALCGHEINMMAAEKFYGLDKVMFGSDFPAVSTKVATWYADNVHNYCMKDPEQLKAVMFKNALELFPRFAKDVGVL